MIVALFFTFWRLLQIVTLIPILGMLAWFVRGFQKQNLLTPNYILVLFITSVLGAVWAIVTVLRRKSTRRSAIFVAFVDLGFVGALIAGVYVLRGISKANCAHFESSRDFYISLDNDGFSGQSPFSFSLNKSCAMLKAAFALGIMNIIFFFITSCLLLFMHRSGDKEVVVKETYTSRRRSHDSRRGHSRSGSGHHRSSRDSRRQYYV